MPNGRLALIDYGAGNLASVRKGFAAVGVEIATAAAARDLEAARGIVVPGVGHFSATAALGPRWRELILRRTEAGTPLLGICLGMQWLFEGSAEAPELTGIGLLRGKCSRVVAARPLKVPHVGWNTLSVRPGSGVLAGVADGSYVYFTHGFAAPVTADCAATTEHGGVFAAAVERDHVWGVQFHPEKSSEAGLTVLRNFVRLARS